MPSPQVDPALVCGRCGREAPRGALYCPHDGSSLGSAGGGGGVQERVGGCYAVEALLARGGMARVVRARHLARGDRVAIKILHPEWLEDPIALERLRLEAAIGRQLNGPAFVRILELFEPDAEPPALVMQLLEGRDLRGALKADKALSPARVVRLIAQTALALKQAHGLSIVHRDLKPENLFLVGEPEQERVVLLDFGSARDNGGRTRKLTLMGTTIGSPFYMAPEQARGLEDLDQRADVWSLGAIAYECLTGSVPFAGSNGPSILLAILTQELTPPSRMQPSSGAALPSALDPPILAALAKQTRDRTATATEFASALGSALGLSGNPERWAWQPLSVLETEVRRAGARRSRWLPPPWGWWALALAALAVLALLAFLALRSPAPG